MYGKQRCSLTITKYDTTVILGEQFFRHSEEPALSEAEGISR